ncbi:MAG: diaminopimelate decarboxylase [Bryobacteraceae bacterium]
MPEHFHYEAGALYCERIDLARIAARAGTPCYLYSTAAILEAYRAYEEGLDGVAHRVCYAIKANSNLAVLALLVKAGAGFDIVSGGELFRAIRAGADPAGIVFSGVGKTAPEIEYALDAGIHAFNCESEEEIALLDALAARRGGKARAAVRINPDVAGETHPYISTGLREHKFGVAIAEAEGVYERARRFANVALDGVSCHIGSQLDPEPLLEALDRVLELMETLRANGHTITRLDLGGGLHVPYKPSEPTPDIRGFAARICEKVRNKGVSVTIEPGRSIVAAAGVLLTRVLYRKRNGGKEFVIVDAGMNDLIRPALYRSHHEIIPVRQNGRPNIVADVVGPVCETGDFLARHREVADALPGDLLAVTTAGAYGFVAASNYNARPRPAEVLVDGENWRVVRPRESFEDLIRGEQI